MRSPKDYRPVSTETRRIPLLRRVSLKWGKERDSVEEMGINLSMTGMFVRSDSPRAIGATAAFVMSLAEGEVPIEGIAEVAWIRDRDEGDSHPPGMGMRFLRVSGEGRRRIRETVERLVEETSAPAELRDLRLVVERTLEDIFAQRDEVEDLGRGASALAPPPRADAGAAVALSGSPPASRRLGWLLGLLLLAGIGTVAYLAGSGGRGTDLPELASSDRSPPQAPPAAPAAPITEMGTIPSSDVAQAAEAESESEVLEGVRSAVSAWAADWSRQQAEAYLAHYSEEYQPPGGLGRQAWEEQRKQRLAAPAFIEVSVSDLEVRLESPNRATAEFVQSYRSDRYRDSVRKSQRWVNRDGRWRITEERGL